LDNERREVLALLDKHSQQAADSAYDRGVCVLAVSRARECIALIGDDIPQERFREVVRQRLAKLIDGYRDEDSVYTSGKSVLVPILDDLFK
jgi:hypothetical protein